MTRSKGATWAVSLIAVLSLIAAACGGGDTAEPTEPATSTAPVEEPIESPEMTTNEAGAIMISAEPNATELGFTPTVLEAPAGEEFVIMFSNNDPGIPHNVQIFEGDTPGGEILWAPKNDATINGGETVDYEIPALDAGTYAFNCYVHPTTMTGTITVS